MVGYTKGTMSSRGLAQIGDRSQLGVAAARPGLAAVQRTPNPVDLADAMITRWDDDFAAGSFGTENPHAGF